MKDLDKKNIVIRKDVGDIIKTARENKHWTQEQMGEKMNITQRQYNKYEAGKFPKFKTTVAEEIDKLLGTNSKELLYEQTVPHGTTKYVKNDQNTIANEKDEVIKQSIFPKEISNAQVLEVIASLVRQNEKVVDTNKTLADKVASMPIANDHKENFAILSARINAIQELIIKLGTGKHWKNRKEALEELGKMLPSHQTV